MRCTQANGDGRRAHTDAPVVPGSLALPPDLDAARERLLGMYAWWAWWMWIFIERYDDATMGARPFSPLPLDNRWAHVPGMTILGDATHLMSPFAAEGVNPEMVDGLVLGWCSLTRSMGGRRWRSARPQSRGARRQRQRRGGGLARWLRGTCSRRSQADSLLFKEYN